MLKKILLVILAIIAIPLIAALFMKKDYAVSREITINKPKAEVFEYIKYLKNQDNYSKWNQMDPAMKKTYTGTDGAVGFIAAWDSEMKEVGAGSQEIMKIAEGERMDMEIRFTKPFESTDLAFMSTEAVGEAQTKVVWGFSGRMDYPMNIMLTLMNMDEMIGADLSTGLTNLKTLMEK
ncbi:MAG: SRPBCC family protein [Saprospiraceae bacterium]